MQVNLNAVVVPNNISGVRNDGEPAYVAVVESLAGEVEYRLRYHLIT